MFAANGMCEALTHGDIMYLDLNEVEGRPLTEHS